MRWRVFLPPAPNGATSCVTNDVRKRLQATRREDASVHHYGRVLLIVGGRLKTAKNEEELAHDLGECELRFRSAHQRRF